MQDNCINGIPKSILQSIKLVASDCDGVLTDGGLYYLENGLEMKRFHVLDGVGFLRLKEKGIKTAIITGEQNHLVKKRAEKLKVDFLIMGSLDKLRELEKLCGKIGVSIRNSAYIGDDVFDISAVKECGMGCVPSSADAEIKKHAVYITKKGGGRGCFRELADMILEAYSDVNYKDEV